MSNIIFKNNRIYIREVKISESKIITKWKKDPLVKKMALSPDMKISLRNQRDDIKRALKSKSDLYSIIVIKKTDKPIGYIRINWFGYAHRLAWLRFALGEERDKGYAKEALICFLNFLFKKGAHRVDAEVYEFNKVSYYLLKSLGFKKEGVRRKAYFDGRNFVDVLMFGLLKKDFIKKRKTKEVW